MPKILLIGRHNSIGNYLDLNPGVLGDRDLLYTQSKPPESAEKNIFHLDFLDKNFQAAALLDNPILKDVDRVVVLSSYYGTDEEAMLRFFQNLRDFILGFISLRQYAARIIFFGSIATEIAPSAYARFKSHIKEFSNEINHSFNTQHISATYLNLGSFRDGVPPDAAEFIDTGSVIDLLRLLILLPDNVKTGYIDFRSLSE